MRDYNSLFWGYLGDVWWVIVLKARTVTEDIDSSTTVTSEFICGSCQFTSQHNKYNII